MGIIKRLHNKHITRKFLWGNILIIILFFLRILDMVLTLIALNLNGYFQESNPFAYFFVENPKVWLVTNFIIIGVFGFVNIILWLLDKKTEITIDKATIIFLAMIMIAIIINIYVVVNNMLLFYNFLR